MELIKHHLSVYFFIFSYLTFKLINNKSKKKWDFGFQ